MIGDNLINREDSCKVGRPGENRESTKSGREIGSLLLKSGELEPSYMLFFSIRVKNR